VALNNKHNRPQADPGEKDARCAQTIDLPRLLPTTPDALPVRNRKRTGAHEPALEARPDDVPMRDHKTEPVIREQERRQFFGRFAHRIPFQITERTAQWLSIRRNRVQEFHEGGFKRIKLKGIK
jgi:hypothetical protein